MKKLLFLLPLGLAVVMPVNADVRHSIKSSATITLDPAYSSATRIGSTYSVSGSNVTPSKTISGTTTSGAIGGLNIGSVTAGVPAFIDTDFTVTTAGSAFSAVESLTQGDAIQSATTVSSGVVGSLPSLGVTVTGSGGVNGGTITSLTSGVHTCSGTMGAGSSCTATSIIETLVD
tara:strand:+ start:257 stop:781 length:525 start_codon:yes stop_codon:yes gene_type:complete